MLTNQATIGGRIKRLKDLENRLANGELEARYSKLEVQRFSEEIEEMNHMYGGIKDMTPKLGAIFVVDVLANLRRIEPRAVAVFAGAGSQEPDILIRARDLGVENSVRLLGWRNDVPEIMSCSDWFILPHPEHPVEGFGLAVVEAQLAGLRMLLSRGILDDPLLSTASFRRLALSDGPGAWARAAMELRNDPSPSIEITLRLDQPRAIPRAIGVA